MGLGGLNVASRQGSMYTPASTPGLPSSAAHVVVELCLPILRPCHAPGAGTSLRCIAARALSLCIFEDSAHGAEVPLCARSALPWSQPVPTPPHIQLLMTAQSDNCAPGAGISSSRISATLRQRLRRHLLRRMSPAWVILELSSLRSVLQAMVDGLARQGTVDLIRKGVRQH